MNYRTGTVLLIGLAAILTAGAVLPVQILYASSGSMAPTIAEGDLYVVVGSDDVAVGDIIAFRSARYDQYVTHRVVGETDAGLITKGDANPTTDQAGGHPPVKADDVIGEVVEVGGTPLVIPGVGTILTVVQSHRVLVGAAVIAVLLLPELQRGRLTRDRPRRRVVTAGSVVRPLLLVAVLGSGLFIFVGASVHDVLFVATAGSSTASHAIPVGEAAVKTVSVETYVPPFTTVIVDANGMAVIERSVIDSTVELTVRVPAKDTLGPYNTRVEVNAYPATLPSGVLEWLDEIHWLVAAVGSMLPIFGPVIATYWYAVDPAVPLRWPRSRWLRGVGGD